MKSYQFMQNKIVGGVGADDVYWQGLEDGQFTIPRCQHCGVWTWPATFRCGDCGSWAFAWLPVDPVGTIFTWTETWTAFDRIAERDAVLPYVTVLVEIPAANNARVLGVLKGPREGLKIGAAVRGTIDPPSPVTKNYPSLRWELQSA